ncbi:hypothetical protein SAMN05444156_3127 [Verrucomicrobium sp. GAS474]|uniref:hypothetical protein n=1 Tax=Verrucomicrobium sp. GAS474 TaxID=1882831 RepID=UPI00087B6E66|nr:hypothetical protein [Verrucomicrobium sp. GAS474]SDU29506.1 hypothetical protein SAMN05444156_3127 [Verrucomicrobium sp. GAS474]
MSTPASQPAFDWKGWEHPPADFSLCPFWFWNDALDEQEIVRQIADFQAHGVEAFLIHPRIGLPREVGWLGERMFSFMRVALEEAKRRGMWVMLYDEGMYPSGSASGQVVARNPAFRTRGLLCSAAGGGEREGRAVAVAARRSGEKVVIREAYLDAVVRGLHYVGDEDAPAPGEEEPPAADLLNPDAVRCFIEVVYDRFHAELGEYFGNTIKAIFTDEPHPLSRCRTQDAKPGSGEFLEWLGKRLGRDFTPHLPALWFNDEPDAALHRREYAEAVAARMDETYYLPLSRWCAARGIALTGHPAEPDDLGHLRHLHIPGQDIVWRHVEPNKPSALEGAPSTMAKAAASAAFHGERPRNLNEFAGAYGENLTFTELRWLASWLLIRGCDLLVPHAFYYSMRGPRRHERPPDVGPNSAWWADYRPWADAMRRLCWLNAVSEPVCHVAILGRATELPWRAARACFERQIDFHYVEPGDLASARVENGELCVGPGRYRALLVEEGYQDIPLSAGTPKLAWPGADGDEILKGLSPVIALDSPAPSLRARHIRIGDLHCFLLFNEGEEEIARRTTFPIGGGVIRLDPLTGKREPWNPQGTLRLPPHGWAIFVVDPQTEPSS